MKVYVVIYHSTYVEGNDFITSVQKVCAKQEDAREEFEKLKKSVKEEDFTFYESEEEETPNSYTIWEKERFSSNYISIQIVEKYIE